MILTKRFVIVVINAMIGYQLGNLTIVPKCRPNHNGATVNVASKRKLFFIAILRSDFSTGKFRQKVFRFNSEKYTKIRQTSRDHLWNMAEELFDYAWRCQVYQGKSTQWVKHSQFEWRQWQCLSATEKIISVTVLYVQKLDIRVWFLSQNRKGSSVKITEIFLPIFIHEPRRKMTIVMSTLIILSSFLTDLIQISRRQSVRLVMVKMMTIILNQAWIIVWAALGWSSRVVYCLTLAHTYTHASRTWWVDMKTLKLDGAFGVTRATYAPLRLKRKIFSIITFKRIAPMSAVWAIMYLTWELFTIQTNDRHIR